jgi:hypothetical protein
MAVVHQAEGMHPPVGLLAGFAERLQEIPPVKVVQEEIPIFTSPCIGGQNLSFER